ncbi:MAG: DUF881 domain-containing protein [Mycolicibacterium sp.]|nr:DUF881 domain-containing protein [Mycolicibacterium sp.]
MSDRDRSLGGYDPNAGMSAHEGERPRLIPVPSLLRSLLSEHLDPGYAAAAAVRDGGAPPRAKWAAWGWQAAAALLVALVFGAAAAQARSVAPGVKQTQQMLIASVRAAQTGTDGLAAQRANLTSDVDNLRRSRLEDDAAGRQLLHDLDQARVAAGATPVTGPGLTVTLTDPGVSRNLSDVSKERIPGSRQVVLDRDLQLVVNSLWASGAEAMAVAGVRIGPDVTIRQAGGAILVDNQPIASPYAVVAIGPPHAMQDSFEASPGLIRMRLLEATYGAGVTVATAGWLEVPAGGTRNVRYATVLQ